VVAAAAAAAAAAVMVVVVVQTVAGLGAACGSVEVQAELFVSFYSTL
jgi:hypothetical protein